MHILWSAACADSMKLIPDFPGPSQSLLLRSLTHCRAFRNHRLRPVPAVCFHDLPVPPAVKPDPQLRCLMCHYFCCRFYRSDRNPIRLRSGTPLRLFPEKLFYRSVDIFIKSTEIPHMHRILYYAVKVSAEIIPVFTVHFILRFSHTPPPCGTPVPHR